MHNDTNNNMILIMVMIDYTYNTNTLKGETIELARTVAAV